MAAERNGIFLTGASGLVGGLLRRRIAQDNPERAIYALVHRRNTITDLPNVRAIPGDITQPRLGIPNDLYRAVCGSIDTIAHCAASTKFTLPLPAAREVNVLGTAHILRLARDTRDLKKLLQVSSTHIAGRRSGPLFEAPVIDPAGWFSPYEQSKFEAEQLICEQGNGLPWVTTSTSCFIWFRATFSPLFRDFPARRWTLLRTIGRQGLCSQSSRENRPRGACFMCALDRLSLCPRGKLLNSHLNCIAVASRSPGQPAPSFVSCAWRTDGTTVWLARRGITPLRTRDFLAPLSKTI